jgi:hypothetical protein
MSLITVVLALVVVGIVLWAVNTYVTFIDAKILKIINAVVIVAVIIWLLYVFGVWQRLDAITVKPI